MTNNRGGIKWENKWGNKWGNKGNRSSLEHVAREVLFSASVAMSTLVFLILFHERLNNIHIPTLRQFSIGLIPQMVFVQIWRHYIYYRLDHKLDPSHDRERNCYFSHQLVPYWYAASCVILAFGNCLIPLQFIFGDHQLQPDTGDPYPFGIFCAVCHAFVASLLGLNLIIDTISFGMRKSAEWGNNTSHRFQAIMLDIDRKTSQFRAPLTFLLSAKIVLGGLLIASEDPIVVHVTVPIRQLPESLDGFRIIQLSDLHVGVSVGRTRVERVVKIVNELCSQTKDNNKCDLVALTGDIIDGEPYQLIKGIEPLKKLVTDIPKLFVTGNHEHIHQNVDHSLEVLSEMGIDCIVNDNIRLPKGKSGQKLVIVGLTDFSVGKNRGWEQRAFEGTKPNQDTIILLAHQPNHLRVARQNGVDLMLSGHTHAGQFFPGTIGAWLFNSKYSGYYPSKETAVYVSAGTHWWGPPVRFTTRHHEITDITLIKMRE